MVKAFSIFSKVIAFLHITTSLIVASENDENFERPNKILKKENSGNVHPNTLNEFEFFDVSFYDGEGNPILTNIVNFLDNKDLSSLSQTKKNGGMNIVARQSLNKRFKETCVLEITSNNDNHFEELNKYSFKASKINEGIDVSYIIDRYSSRHNELLFQAPNFSYLKIIGLKSDFNDQLHQSIQWPFLSSLRFNLQIPLVHLATLKIIDLPLESGMLKTVIETLDAPNLKTFVLKNSSDDCAGEILASNSHRFPNLEEIKFRRSSSFSDKINKYNIFSSKTGWKLKSITIEDSWFDSYQSSQENRQLISSSLLNNPNFSSLHTLQINISYLANSFFYDLATTPIKFPINYLQLSESLEFFLSRDQLSRINRGHNLNSLETLNLSCNSLKDEDIERLSSIRDLPALKYLTLRANEITDTGLRHVIFSSFYSQLHTLDLDMNNISDQGAFDIANSKKSTNLKALYLSTNNLTDEGVKSLLNSPNLYSTLEELHIENNEEVTVPITSEQYDYEELQELFEE